MKFIERTVAPDKEDRLYNSNENPYYAMGLGMPNCTPYAWSRLWEITGKKPETIGVWNACDWFENAKKNGWKVGSEPKLGAVACWAGAGSNPYGHASIVEQIYDDLSFRSSESAWHGIYWNNGLVVSPADNYKHPGANQYTFQGFIYCGIEFNGIDELAIVRRNYIDILERNADKSGIEAYVKMLQSGGTEEKLREDLISSAENINDTEKSHKKWFIVRCYKEILGRYPENDKVVEARLDWSKEAIFNDIWNSNEAKKLRG